MSHPVHRYESKDEIVLGLLESVERRGVQTQRSIAIELGIALGLTNAYLKRCINKGFLKVGDAPARRYAYYLTPKGFAEKSRLTVKYFSHSFSLFRRARAEYVQILRSARERNWRSVVFAGVSDLAEIARIASLESDVEIVGVVDADAPLQSIVGLIVFQDFDDIPVEFDGVIVTDLRSAHETYHAAIKRFGAGQVLAPELLGVLTKPRAR
ncbi:MAG: winged helix-turn-helix transcriptional regulator [Pseudolabrys sp.]|nr:winged helix-turn-helix transcriptional regulator [Pseudolabrys sp.]